jgi:hypothetical protein
LGSVIQESEECRCLDPGFEGVCAGDAQTFVLRLPEQIYARDVLADGGLVGNPVADQVTAHMMRNIFCSHSGPNTLMTLSLRRHSLRTHASPAAPGAAGFGQGSSY